jgi:hypothetical protein
VRKLKVLITLALIVGPVVAVPAAASPPRNLHHAPSADPIIDPDIWTSLTGSPDRAIAFQVETQGGGADELEAALEALRRAGSVSDFSIDYGQSTAYVHGTGHAIRFLAAWPSVTNVSLATDARLFQSDTDGIQSMGAAQATGSFTGTVTAEDGGTPLSDVRVEAFLQTGATTWRLEDIFQTAADGTYTAADLEAGYYRAKFEDPAGNYVPEYYDDQPSFTYATPFTVTEEATFGGVDAALTEAGHITGIVIAVADGAPVADIVAGAWYSTTAGWRSAGSSSTSVDGTFDIGGLGAGNYRVRFADANSPPRYLAEVYNNILYSGPESLDAGDDVPVAAGATTPNIDADLGSYGSIAGTVLSSDTGAPIEGIYADVWYSDTLSLTWEWGSYGTTDASGDYEAAGLDTGDYRVEFTDPSGQFASEVYNNQPDLDSGDDVHVELGFETSGIDAALDLAPDTITQSLASGWNLMSFPVTLDDPATESALETITDIYNVVWAYDACATGDPWLKYDPDDPLSTLIAVDTMHGYWIDLTAGADLTVTGTHPISTAIDLCTGWNLIGYASVDARPVTEVLAPIDGQYDLVYGYDGSDTEDPWKTYNPDAPVGNDLTTMRPWYGYWIHMTDPATLTIPGR